MPDTEQASEAPSANGQGEAMETEEATPPSTTAASPEPQLGPEEIKLREQHNRLASIIRGETSVQLYLEFLHSHNHADLQVQIFTAANVARLQQGLGEIFKNFCFWNKE